MIRNVISWLWLGARLAWDLRKAGRGEASAAYTLTPKARHALDEYDRTRWN